MHKNLASSDNNLEFEFSSLSFSRDSLDERIKCNLFETILILLCYLLFITCHRLEQLNIQMFSTSIRNPVMKVQI